jgi:alkylation response protein AidB-like acyl-CoA dehydrogenase
MSMDFGPAETQRAIAGLAAEVLCGADPWKELARSGLLALAVPAKLGGEGHGILEVATLLTEIGRRAVPVPALGTLAGGVLPIARWGSEELQRELLPAAAAGELILTAATREPSHAPSHACSTMVDHAHVSGVKVGVPYAAEARRILVSTGSGVVLVDPAAPGVTLTRTPTVGGEYGAPEYTVRLDRAPAAAVLDGMTARDLDRLVTAGACALADGALSGALTLTRDYVATRRQFGRLLAEFQAVSQQVADVYIASRTLHLITLSACWRLGTERDADGDLTAATWWVTEEAVQAVMTCHHLHGGVGVDVSYPMHRFSSLIRDLARSLGGASVH